MSDRQHETTVRWARRDDRGVDRTAARDAFEAWAKARGMYPARREGQYPDSAARFAWDVWIAAWTEATNGR